MDEEEKQKKRKKWVTIGGIIGICAMLIFDAMPVITIWQLLAAG